MPIPTPAIKWLLRYWPLPAVLILLLMTWWHGYHRGELHREQVWTARWYAHVAEDATSVADATTAARVQEQQWLSGFDLAANLYQESVNEVQNRRNSLMRDIAAGRLRLPATPSSVPAAAADPGGAAGKAPTQQLDLVARDVTERLAECDAAIIEGNLRLDLLQAERAALTVSK